MPAAETGDEIDQIVEFWHSENPDLDVTAKTLAMRLRRASLHLERTLRANLAESGVDEFWEIEVLLSLKRAPGHRRSAGDLLRECHVTSGAITNRVDRLERRGWVRRDTDPDDRRQVLISLTDEGLAQANHVITTKNQCEQRLFSRVDRKLLERVTVELRTVLRAMDDHQSEQECAPEPEPAG
jgi:DNA-binding MarR family transcriptional regulator